MKIEFVKLDASIDWYVIERTDVPKRVWMERTGPHAMALRCSTRIADADVEGSREEMETIAQAVIKGEYESFKRCATKTEGDRVVFWSPRNSATEGYVPREAALTAAKAFLAEVSQ